MRNISLCEMELVSGAAGLSDVANAATVGGAIGGGTGASLAISAGGSGSAILGVAGIGAAVGAGLAASFYGGLAIGSWLNENTGIQDFIADLLPDPSGTNYQLDGTNYQ